MNKNFFPKQILIILSLAVLLDVARLFIFHSTYFMYLLWNMFLAVLPFVVSSLLLYYVTHRKISRSLLVMGLIFWLLLLPNAPYIITDIIHLNRNHAAPLLYDTFLIFSSGWAGLLLGMYSVSHIEKILLRKYSQKRTSIIIAAIILISSFGMYLGRFMRFNSWDVVSSAELFFTKITHIFLQPAKYSDAYLFTSLSFIFFYMSYIAWKYSVLESKNSI